MSSMGTAALLAIFLGAALATWVAGVSLAKATDVLDDRYGLGEALGGMILLSVPAASPNWPSPCRRRSGVTSAWRPGT
jgi:cation:H+ antiporter